MREAHGTLQVEWTQEESASYGVTPFSMGAPSNQSFLPGQATWGGDATHSLQAPSGVLTLRLGELRLLVSGFHYLRTMPLVGTFNDPFAREEQSGARLDLSYGWQASSKLRLMSRLYGGYAAFSERSNYGESFWCIEGQDGCHFEMRARSGWLGLEQTLSADWFSDGKVLTTVGYDVRPRFFDATPGGYTDLVSNAPPTVIPLPKPAPCEPIVYQRCRPRWRYLRT